MKEIKAVDRSGDDGPAGVTQRDHGAGQIHEVHDFSAKHVAQAVGVIGESEFAIL
jgi:hypothetical protein